MDQPQGPIMFTRLVTTDAHGVLMGPVPLAMTLITQITTIVAAGHNQSVGATRVVHPWLKQGQQCTSQKSTCAHTQPDTELPKDCIQVT